MDKHEKKKKFVIVTSPFKGKGPGIKQTLSATLLKP